ncbi:MAG TPA: hypothetical protein VMX13_01140 [Sedimentisphaerales bacterium]|nr:hypothetical protein [Sedimentisphaerales bacterium]
MRNMKSIHLSYIVLFLMFPVSLCYSDPIDTSFTYQGQLKELGEPAMGLYDFVFTLYDAEINGSQIGDALLLEDVVVSNGLFSVLLDFGEAPFDGNLYWLEIDVKPIDINDFTTLTPRQEINPAPYAVYAKTSGSSAGVIKGPGIANYIAKYLDPNTLIESVIYESDGNIGIGTASPDEKLHVVGNIRATGTLIGAVDWANLASVPTGFADGVDDVGVGAETDPTVAESVKDGVSWSELLDVPLGFADGVDDVGTEAETDPTVTESVKDGVSWDEVSSKPAGLDDGDDVGITVETDPTVLASVKDGVSWGELAEIPSGFADGIDNVGSGGDSDWTISGNDMYSTVSGDVGIGTISPTAKLDVNGTAKATAFVGDGSGLTNLPTGSGEDSDWTISDSNMYSAVSGNVGIGSSTPVEKLDVIGNIAVSGTVDGVDISAHVADVNAHHSQGIPQNIQAFITSGTWIKPANVSTVYVKVWGGGGGGASGEDGHVGASGAGGGYAEGLISVSGDMNVTVGSGGIGGGTGGAPGSGTNGNTSSFAGDTIIQATGGTGATYDPAGGYAGPGGVGSGGAINLSGGPGTHSNWAFSDQQSGAKGGDSPMGGGGGSGGAGGTQTGRPGTSGTVPGGGGGGGSTAGSGWGWSHGGDGANGLVIVMY